MQRTDPLDHSADITRSGASLSNLRPAVVIRAHRVDILLASALFALACWQFLSLVDATPFHRDEARWVHRAEYARQLVHPFGSYWDESNWIAQGGTLDERYRLRNQPPLGSYVMGLGLLAQGRDLDVNGFRNMDHDDAWNTARGNLPDSNDLEAARRTTAVVSALTVLAVYFIGRRVTNRVGGVVAALFLMVHPLVELYAAFAGSDMLLILTVALATIAAYRLADQPSWPRTILLGILLGLGGAAKLSPLVVSASFALVGGLIILHRLIGVGLPWRKAPMRLGLQLISVPVFALAAFVGSYPYLWRAPIDHTWALFDYRKLGMDIQGSIWAHVAVDSPAEALDRVQTRLGDDFSVLSRLSPGMGISGNMGMVDVWVAVIGLAAFVLMGVRRGPWSGHALAFAVLGGQAVVTIVGMRVDWARYHLPIVLLAAVCIGIAVGLVWEVIRRYGFRRTDTGSVPT